MLDLTPWRMAMAMVAMAMGDVLTGVTRLEYKNRRD